MNHTISKQRVLKAKRTRSGIAVEDLKNIWDGAKARKSQRKRLHNGSFDQLRSFLSDKSRREGVELFVIDLKNTSRTCPECGYVDKKNRKSQDRFSFIACGYSALADDAAARNIAKVAVNRPEFSLLFPAIPNIIPIHLPHEQQERVSRRSPPKDNLFTKQSSDHCNPSSDFP